MLFDLRSRGRRRTVQVVYLGLAILMGAGLILFGVGAGNGFGGLLNALEGNGSGSNQKQVLSQDEKNALKEVKANPNSAQAWGDLLQARWVSAQNGVDSSTSPPTINSAARQELVNVGYAWTRYSALTKSPDPTLAVEAARSYAFLGDYRSAANAWQAETLSSPTELKGYECLAVSAYAAGDSRLGDLASAKALQLVPKNERLTITPVLTQAKSSVTTAKQDAQQC